MEVNIHSFFLLGSSSWSVVWDCGGGEGGGGGGDRSWPCVAAQRSCAGAGPLLRAGAQLPVDCISLLGGGWLVLLRGCDACLAVCGGLQSEAALIDVRLDVGSLAPRSSSPTVAGCWPYHTRCSHSALSA